MPDYDLLFWGLALVAAFLVGLSKGGLSSVGTLAVPIMALSSAISPVAAAGLLLPIYIVSDMFGLWQFRREYSPINLKIIIPGAAAGIVTGWALASVVPETWVRIVIGVIGIVFCVDRFLKRGTPQEPRPADVPRGLFWGAVAGFTSFVSHSGAPPYQIYVLPQRLPKMVYAGTSTIAFAAINLMKLPPYVALGQISVTNLPLTAILAVVAIAGTFIGFRLTRMIPERPFYIFVTVMLFLVSVKLTFDGVSAVLHGH